MHYLLEQHTAVGPIPAPPIPEERSSGARADVLRADALTRGPIYLAAARVESSRCAHAASEHALAPSRLARSAGDRPGPAGACSRLRSRFAPGEACAWHARIRWKRPASQRSRTRCVSPLAHVTPLGLACAQSHFLPRNTRSACMRAVINCQAANSTRALVYPSLRQMVRECERVRRRQQIWSRTIPRQLRRPAHGALGCDWPPVQWAVPDDVLAPSASESRSRWLRLSPVLCCCACAAYARTRFAFVCLAWPWRFPKMPDTLCASACAPEPKLRILAKLDAARVSLFCAENIRAAWPTQLPPRAASSSLADDPAHTRCTAMSTSTSPSAHTTGYSQPAFRTRPHAHVT